MTRAETDERTEWPGAPGTSNGPRFYGAIASRFAGGESIAHLAEDYHISQADVVLAVRVASRESLDVLEAAEAKAVEWRAGIVNGASMYGITCQERDAAIARAEAAEAKLAEHERMFAVCRDNPREEDELRIYDLEAKLARVQEQTTIRRVAAHGATWSAGWNEAMETITDALHPRTDVL